MSESIGMMEGAYFVSRTELLKWVNDLLQLSYAKVEQCANGAAYCQIFDVLYTVPLHKVNFQAKQEYEYINNYKVLQNIFNKHGIERHIDVDKLIRGKYQDNLEFLQWTKAYFDRHYNGEDYNAVERRKSSAASFNRNKGGPKSKAAKDEDPAASAIAKTATATATTKTATAPKTTTTTTKRPASSTATTGAPKGGPGAVRAAAGAGNEKVKELMEHIGGLKLTIEGLEKERDFYFGKLRDIEIYCQTHDNPDDTIIAAVQKILYATDDDFGPAEDEATVENE